MNEVSCYNTSYKSYMGHIIPIMYVKNQQLAMCLFRLSLKRYMANYVNTLYIANK